MSCYTGHSPKQDAEKSPSTLLAPSAVPSGGCLSLVPHVTGTRPHGQGVSKTVKKARGGPQTRIRIPAQASVTEIVTHVAHESVEVRVMSVRPFRAHTILNEAEMRRGILHQRTMWNSVL